MDEAKKRGVTYSDIRLIEDEIETIETENGNVQGIGKSFSKGFGIRVLLNGAWGFSSSSKVDKYEMEKVLDEAINIAKASSKIKKEDVILSEIEIYEDEYIPDIKIDPFTVGLDKKLNLLYEVDKIMSNYKPVKIRRGSLYFDKQKKFFVSTEGSFIVQDRIVSGSGIEAYAIGDTGEVQRRSYPAALGGDFSVSGWEFIETLKLIENSDRVAKQSVELLKAKPCPQGFMDIVISGDQMALQVHESLGHPVELDRVFGMEASYAGTSFLTPEKLNNFMYGSKKVNITADATIPHALGGFKYDDEGVKAQRVYLVKEGAFVGYLTSRETAHKVGLKPMGAMRADGWNRIPLIRMTSINLEPLDMTFEDLISGIKDGIYVETNKSWSIDDKRLNFQFGCEIGWEIKDGKLGDMIKNPTYTGISYEFWRSCDGVGNEDLWHVWGVPNCGKGEPPQIMQVSHGTAPARFRNVRVGVVR
ncbi:MAG: TldD/PmbA family protein [Caldisericia bacterium]